MALRGLPELIVDFNEMDAQRRIYAHLVDENAGSPIAPGDEVFLRDDEGATCRALVVRVSGREALLDPAWSTWLDPEPVRVTTHPQTPEAEMYYALVSRVGQFSGAGAKKRTPAKSGSSAK
ncbi:MAG TPA: hypothetical protein VMN35_03760 [Gaiellaceae bacterium]|nr:hypothetical protein [Gaiellaceae bacterium]